MTGGKRMPSSKIGAASRPACSPGPGLRCRSGCRSGTRTRPARPSKKIGRSTSMSGVCWIAPPHRYGSLSISTSPGSRSSCGYSSRRSPPAASRTGRRASGRARRRCSGNESCSSRITVDIAARKMTASISRRMFLSAFSMMSITIGDSLRSCESAPGFWRMMMFAKSVDLDGRAREDERGRVGLDDDRGPVEAMAGGQLRPVIQRRLEPFTAVVDPLGADPGRVLVRFRRRPDRRRRCGAVRPSAIARRLTNSVTTRAESRTHARELAAKPLGRCSEAVRVVEQRRA